MTETNREFAASPDGKFWQCCRFANVKPSTRQASKFRNKKGIAYKVTYDNHEGYKPLKNTHPGFG